MTTQEQFAFNDIDVVKKVLLENGFDLAHDVLHQAEGVLKRSIEEHRWIPVTERLPEEGEKVLATHLGGVNPNRQVIEHIYDKGFTCGWDIDLDITSPTFGQRYMGDIIAWMPEPKPYDKGAEE